MICLWWNRVVFTPTQLSWKKTMLVGEITLLLIKHYNNFWNICSCRNHSFYTQAKYSSALRPQNWWIQGPKTSAAFLFLPFYPQEVSFSFWILKVKGSGKDCHFILTKYFLLFGFLHGKIYMICYQRKSEA